MCYFLYVSMFMISIYMATFCVKWGGFKVTRLLKAKKARR